MGKFGKKTRKKKVVAAVMANYSDREIEAVVKRAQEDIDVKAAVEHSVKVAVNEMKRHLAAQQTAFELDAVQRYMTFVLSVLHGEFGWGKVRLDRLLTLVREWEGDIKQSRTKIPEIQAVLEADTGIKLCQDNCVSILFGAEGVVVHDYCNIEFRGEPSC